MNWYVVHAVVVFEPRGREEGEEDAVKMSVLWL